MAQRETTVKQQRLEQFAVMGVGRGQHGVQREPVRVAQDVVLRSGFAPVSLAAAVRAGADRRAAVGAPAGAVGDAPDLSEKIAIRGMLPECGSGIVISVGLRRLGRAIRGGQSRT